MLGSRIKRRSQDALVAAVTSAPRKPLLFLYPQWVRNSSTSAPQLDEASLAGQNHGDPSVTLDKSNSTTNAERSRNLSRTLEAEDSLENDGAREPGRRSPKSPQRLIRRVLGNVNRLRNDAITDSRVRQEYYDQRRLERGTWVPDWRIILSEMLKHTPDAGKWLDKAVVVSVAQGPQAEQLMFGIDDNIWDIAKKHGCTVSLARSSDATEGRQSFLLSGPNTAVGKTATEVLSLTENKAVVSLNSKDMSSSDVVLPEREPPNTNPPIRTVMSDSRDRQTVLVTKASELPRPSKWTTDNFAAYVHQLTRAIVPNHIHPLVYTKGEEGKMDVVKTLLDVFADPKALSSISRKAFHEAMTYLVKLNRIADARALFVRMDMAKLQMDPETFNIMLRGAAKAEDLHNFHYILHLMFRWGFTPNQHTWIAFLMAVKDVRIKAHIISAMKQKGLVNHTVLKSIGEQFVSEEITFSLEKGQSLEEFLRRMDQQYGATWLTTSGGNRILHVLGSHGLMFQCWRFLQEMEKRFVKIDTVSINTCLAHCKTFKNLESAVEIMKRLWNFQPDDLTYSLLFQLAVSSNSFKSFNVARVVWKYACLSAATTVKMRAFMVRSLKRATEHPSEKFEGTLKDFVYRFSGLIISGVSPPQALPAKEIETQRGTLSIPNILEQDLGNYLDPVSTIAAPSADKESVFIQRILAGHQFSNKERKEWYDVTRSISQRDYNIFKEWKPVRPFADMLEEALAREHEWKRNWENTIAPLSSGDLRWRLGNAVSVPIRRKGSADQQIYQWR